MASKAKTNKGTAVDAVDDALSIEFADQDDLNVADLDLDDIEAQLENAASELRNEAQREIEGTSGNSAAGSNASEPVSATDFDAGPPEHPPVPANDAYESELSKLIYAMQQKPRSHIFLGTAIVSLIWLAGCAVYAYTNILSSDNTSLTGASLFDNVPLMTVVAVAIIPLLPLWAFASLTKRAFEMRHAANSMMAAAVKLLQPEKISTDSIATVGHAIRREVAAIGDGMNQAIARASELEFMVQKEVMNLERSYGDSEMRLRRLVEEISTERDEIVTHADKLRGVINASSTSLASELELATGKIEDSILSSSSNLRNTLETEGLAVTTRFSDAGESIVAMLTETGETVSTNLSESTSLFEKTMAERTASMKEVISTTGSTIASLLETRSAQINTATGEVEKRLDAGHRAFEITFGKKSEELNLLLAGSGQKVADLIEEQSDNYARKGEELSRSIEESRKAFDEDVNEKIGEIRSSISTVSKDVSQSLSSGMHDLGSQGRELVEAIEAGRHSFRTDVDTKIGQIGTVMATAGNTVNAVLEASSKNLSERSSAIVSEIEASQAAFNAELDGKTSEISLMMSQSTDRISSALETGAEGLEKTGDRIIDQTAERLSARAADFAGELGGIIDNMQSGLDEKLSGVESSIRDNGNSLVNALGMRTEALDKVLQERTGAIGSTIAERLSGFGRSLTGQVDEAIAKLQEQIDKLEENTKSVEDVIASRTDKAESTLKSQTIAFVKAAEEAVAKNRESSDAISAELASVTATLDDHLQLGSKAITDTFDSRQSRLVDELDARNEALSGKLESLLEQLAGKFDTRGAELTAGLDEKSRILAASLDERTEHFSQLAAAKMSEIETRFSGTAEGLEAAITTSTESLSEALQEKTTNLASKLNQGAHRIASTLEEKTTDATSRMEKSVADLEGALQRNNANIEQQFAAGSKILEDRLETGKDGLLGAISQTISEAGSAIDGKAEKISQLLEQRASLINANLGRELVATQRSLEEKTNDFNKMIADRADELNSILTSRTAQMTGDFDERTARLNSILTERSAELSSIIENDAKPIMSSLEQTSSLVSERLSGLSKMVAEETNHLFGNLGQSSELLGQLINEASTNLTLMQNTLDQQTTKFAETTNITKANLDKTGAIATEMSEQLEDKISTLLGNLNHVAQRFEAQGIALQDSTKLIDAAQSNLEATLENKQEALQELSSGLLSRSDEIDSSVSRFGQMITAMVDDLANKSRGVGSNVADEVGKAINEATSRFSSSVEEMRTAANSIRNELENTREQMRRGILELPDETEKSANAMRRVVNDQISALRDLSDLVEKSGRMIDVAPAVETARNTAHAVGGGQPDVSPQRTYQQAAPQQQPRQRVEDPSIGDFRDTLRLRRGQSSAQQFSNRETASQQQPQRNREPVQTSGQQSGGWVSDLLRRASQNEQDPSDTRSPNQVVDSLNSLSLDIASAIDHETSVDLWERYQRGERNVFTRRLYTLQGQQTFDEISRKYSRDRDFRSAVDRYIEDFERLLTDVARNDPNDGTTQEYLTSDQGKVYTMLAHASGRFGSN